MPLQDVSNDPHMLDWLHTAGHGHLLGDQSHSSSAPHPATTSGEATNYTHQPDSSPIHSGDHHLDAPQHSPSPHFQTSNSGNPPTSFHQTSYGGSPSSHFQTSNSSNPPASFHQTSYGSSPPPPTILPPLLSHPQANYGGITSNSPTRFTSSPMNYDSTHFLNSGNHQQMDVDIEALRRDPNTKVVQRPPAEDVVYKQRVFVRYLQPPTPPVSGTIIVREKQAPPPAPDPP
ncbi:unnamed protein product [Didymodactylos carnosus]|uniref:Uncharacterized protein n=1 Tax=Didymodactylos carnosus TaxID=1234261 RepID=A0A813S5R0_9BILA|nr:unnamed protein product [Didymodactylos carnosus]CAF3574642.1 unnamed protein product [Didymodactylos carnosus]